jgi:uncharacterized protein DUF5675
MTWQLLLLTRRGFRDADGWGTLLMMTANGQWEMLSHSYELPWQEDAKGRSRANKSRIVEGEFELHPRSDGPKGWRLELMGTGHRQNVQVHRAHRSLYIEGCILPVDFLDFRNAPAGGVGPVEIIRKGDTKIEQRSITLMRKIKDRYESLRIGKSGNPTITIGAILPALERTVKTMFA